MEWAALFKKKNRCKIFADLFNEWESVDILCEFFHYFLKPSWTELLYSELFLAKCKPWAVDEDKHFHEIRSGVKL